MKIQVNLDNVVLDFFGGTRSPVGFLDYLNARMRRRKVDKPIRLFDLKSYDLAKEFEISQQELNSALMSFYKSDNFSSLSLMPYFSQFSDRARVNDHLLYAVTSRPRLLTDSEIGKESFVEKATLANLETARIFDSFEELIFIRDDFLGDYSYVKAMYAKEQGMDLVIDHRPEVIDACIGLGVKAKLFRRPWNQTYALNEDFSDMVDWNNFSFS